MAIAILPLLGTISGLAATAWDTYGAIKRTREALAKKSGKPSQASLLERVEKLEETSLEQARMTSELSKDLEQFARAMQEEMEQVQRRYAVLRNVLFATVIVAGSALGLALYLILK